MKRREHTQGCVKTNWADAVRIVLKGGVLAAISTLLMLVLGSLAIAAGLVPMGYMWPMLLFGCVMGSFIAGILARRKMNARSSFLGVGIGFLEFLIFLTAGFLVYGTNGDRRRGGAILIACICGGIVSGLKLKNDNKKHRNNKTGR